MKRSPELLIKRQQFIKDYLEKNSDKQMNQVVKDLSDRLFLTQRTIYNIIKTF